MSFWSRISKNTQATSVNIVAQRFIQAFHDHGVQPSQIPRLPVQVDAANTSDGNIQFDIQRGASRINIRWPVAGADACAQWLGAWLK